MNRAPLAVRAITVRAITVLAVLVWLLAACGDDDDSASSTTNTSASSSSTTVTTLPATTTTRPPATTTTSVPPTPATVIRSGSTSPPAVALTFDAGSDAGYTAQILDTLAANGVPASFGLTGEWVEQNPALAARIAGDGHQILNHTYDHQSFTGRSTGDPPLTGAQRADELNGADSAIRTATGVSTPPWFRPPYGDYDDSVLVDVAASGYRYVVMWTVDSTGWEGATVDEIVDQCLDHAAGGVIYLFHVGSASQDGPALQQVIDGLRALGFSFTTVAELIDA